ncbi:MAG: hypothetical protein ACREOH_21010 [Candidatus Entotheonellia bacterium]
MRSANVTPTLAYRICTGGVLTGRLAGGPARTTHREENTHASLRVRTITRHHASPGTSLLAWPVGEVGQASRHLRGIERR